MTTIEIESSEKLTKNRFGTMLELYEALRNQYAFEAELKADLLIAKNTPRSAWKNI